MKLLRALIAIGSITSLLLMLVGCAVIPKELDSQGQDDGGNFSRKVEDLAKLANMLPDERYLLKDLGSSEALSKISFARGDMLRIRIFGMDQYDGLYQISSGGALELPFSPAFSVTGLSREALINKIETELVRLKWFYSRSVNVDLSVVKLASVNVSVEGAVFSPGRVGINGQPLSKAEDAIQHVSGAFSSGRDLVAALTAAGGIRPDADPSEIYLVRKGNVWNIPINDLINGSALIETPMLINGDRVIVGSTGALNPLLVTPTQVTPPGMRVFMSNLTAPAFNNSQAAVGADSTRLPYGSSLLDSAISANCIGGTHQANASRSVILVTRNFGSKQQLVVRRSINQLLAGSSDRLVNPFMMPNDAIACYDSRFTNFRDVARGIGEIISPILLGRLL